MEKLIGLQEIPKDNLKLNASKEKEYGTEKRTKVCGQRMRKEMLVPKDAKVFLS